jgi:hypothetical protein
MRMLLSLVTIAGAIPFGLLSEPGPAAAASCARGSDFNPCILAAVQLIHASRERLGYGGAYFTRDLDYGPFSKVIRASRLKPKTMCVAAVTEVAIEALNIYYSGTHDRKPFDDLAYSHWNDSTALDIRDYIWENRGSHSAGYAFAKFGVGQELDFKALRPGDFLSFDRGNGGGHSTIFIAYLDKNYTELSAFGPDVVGFKYYSAQGSGVSGFAYRWAFFMGADGGHVCDRPDLHPDKFRDCFGRGIVRSSVSGRGGRLTSPPFWTVAAHVHQLHDEYLALLSPTLGSQYANQLSVVSTSGSTAAQHELLDSPQWKQPLSQAPDLKPVLDQALSVRNGATGANLKRIAQSPAWTAFVLSAAELELKTPDDRIDPKFLPPLN